MSDEKEIPNLDRLIKLMMMTTSQVDAEALMALRAANKQVASFGSNWEAILRGKISITLVEDPLNSIAKPPERHREPPSPPPRRPRSNYRNNPPPPQQPYTPQSIQVHSTRNNTYAGNCHMCGTWVISGGGFITKHTNRKWIVLCDSCNSSGRTIPDRAATKLRPSSDQLMGDL